MMAEYASFREELLGELDRAAAWAEGHAKPNYMHHWYRTTGQYLRSVRGVVERSAEEDCRRAILRLREHQRRLGIKHKPSFDWSGTLDCLALDALHGSPDVRGHWSDLWFYRGELTALTGSIF